MGLAKRRSRLFWFFAGSLGVLAGVGAFDYARQRQREAERAAPKR